MEAARVAATRGHSVTLCDRGERLGGQMLLASRLPAKASWIKMVDYYEYQLEKLGVDVRLQTSVDGHWVSEYRPDAVVLAAGAQPAPFRLPGATAHPVMDVFEILNGRLPPGKRAVVIGGQRGGAEIASYLACEGYQVQIVVRGSDPSYIAANEGLSTRPLLMEELSRSGVEFLFGTDALALVEGGIQVRQDGMVSVVPCDAVVQATGLEPNNGLKSVLREGPWDLYLVGDCVAPRGFDDAIREAFHLGIIL